MPCSFRTVIPPVRNDASDFTPAALRGAPMKAVCLNMQGTSVVENFEIGIRWQSANCKG
jgi:hypothetical protein